MKNVLILILFLLIIIAALLVVLIARKEKRIIHEEEERWYYVVFVCEKFTLKAGFWHGTPDQLAIWLEGKHVESITKLD